MFLLINKVKLLKIFAVVFLALTGLWVGIAIDALIGLHYVFALIVSSVAVMLTRWKLFPYIDKNQV
jgi:hypothetical protein